MIAFGLFLGPIFWAGIVWLGTAAVLAGLATLAYHALLWLLDGTWTAWSFGAALAAAGIVNLSPSTANPDGIVLSIMALPGALGLVGAGLLLGWIGSAARTAANKRERERRTKGS